MYDARECLALERLRKVSFPFPADSPLQRRHPARDEHHGKPGPQRPHLVGKLQPADPRSKVDVRDQYVRVQASMASHVIPSPTSTVFSPVTTSPGAPVMLAVTSQPGMAIPELHEQMPGLSGPSTGAGSTTLPEPASLGLLGFCVLGVAAAREWGQVSQRWFTWDKSGASGLQIKTQGASLHRLDQAVI